MRGVPGLPFRETASQELLACFLAQMQINTRGGCFGSPQLQPGFEAQRNRGDEVCPPRQQSPEVEPDHSVVEQIDQHTEEQEEKGKPDEPADNERSPLLESGHWRDDAQM